MRCVKRHTWQLRVGYKVQLGSPKLATAIWNVFLQLADSELAKSDRTTVGHHTCCRGVAQPQLLDAFGAVAALTFLGISESD